ncbi:hypothetical protein, partial [Photobacterium damselae]|uniref:hypothetical protein n=1 Tax=Photobacterium damselae TaxID=38293 RepID=UPI001EFE97B6
MKIFLNFLFICSIFVLSNCYATEQPLVFSMVAKISAGDLDYKITNITLTPNNVELEFDDIDRKFKNEEIKLDIESNIIEDTVNTYNYVLTVQDVKSQCVLWDGTNHDYMPPVVYIMNDGKKIELGDT